MHAEPKIDFEEHRLENGLQVVLYPRRTVPLVHLSLHYRVGSSYEEAGLSGLAHLFEHMMFQGSENVDRNQHGRHIDSAGGSWNASTNKDRTNYYETVPAHFLDLALWLEADRMRSLKVTRKNFENQRSTVIEEKKQSYDNRPYGLAYLRFDELAYSNWAYAHPIIGSVDDLQKVTLEDAVRFHETFYGPGNSTLVLSGDFEPGEALERVRFYFESIPDRTRPRRPDLSEPTQKAPKEERMEDPLAVLPALSIGYKMSELGSSEYYALVLISLILSSGESSRFYRKFVYESNCVTSLSAGPNQYKGPELFVIWLQLQQNVSIDAVVQAVDDELKRVQDEGVTEAELAKARNQLAARFLERLSTVGQIGEWLARYAVYFDDPAVINSELQRFLVVTAEDLLEVARRTFQPRGRTLLAVEPGGGNGSRTSPTPGGLA